MNLLSFFRSGRDVRTPVLLLLAMAAMLAACGPQAAPTPGDSPLATATPQPEPQDLTGTLWRLDSLRGDPLLPGTQITISFKEDQPGGFGGCNAYGLGVDDDYMLTPEGEFRPGTVARTAMACQEPAGLMEQEDAYFEALAQVAAYHVEGDRLELRDASGQAVLVFSRQPALTMDPRALPGTAWQLVTLNGRPPLEGSRFTLDFHGQGRASGTTGCRDVLFGYQAEPSGLHFYSTAMLGQGCLDATGAAAPGSEPLLEEEGAYTTAMEWVDRFDLSPDRLELLSQRGDSLVFEPLPAAAQPPLEGTGWRLLSFVEPRVVEGMSEPLLMATDALPGTQVTATFAGGTVGGSAGCNSYGGDYSLAGGELAVGPLTRTEMACLEPPGAMEQEDRFLAWLQDAAQAHVYGTQLWLKTADGRALIFTSS